MLINFLATLDYVMSIWAGWHRGTGVSKYYYYRDTGRLSSDPLTQLRGATATGSTVRESQPRTRKHVCVCCVKKIIRKSAGLGGPAAQHPCSPNPKTPVPLGPSACNYVLQDCKLAIVLSFKLVIRELPMSFIV